MALVTRYIGVKRWDKHRLNENDFAIWWQPWDPNPRLRGDWCAQRGAWVRISQLPPYSEVVLVETMLVPPLDTNIANSHTRSIFPQVAVL